MNKIIHALVIGLIALSTLQAFAGSDEEMRSIFNKMTKTFKGPFGDNMLQGKSKKCPVKKTGCSVGGTLFQAAYRNENFGRPLADEYDFWTGNLFTANYYQLLGEYVYDGIESNHPVEPEKLLANSAAAMPKAASMVRHWVLENHYRDLAHNKFTAAFDLRGIGSSEYEPEYAHYFFNFYMSSMDDERQYLPAFVLLSESPVSESAALSVARKKIQDTYDYQLLLHGGNTKDSMVADLYQIRNAVHNRMSEDIVGMINSFLQEYKGDYNPKDDRNHLITVRDIIIQYYSTNASSVVEKAKNFPAILELAKDLKENGVSGDRLLAISSAIAELRTNIGNADVVPSEAKTEALLLISVASSVIDKEINRMKDITSVNVVEALVNVVYAQGFLTLDNWAYFAEEVRIQANPVDAAAQLGDVFDIAQETVFQAFEPAYEQWLVVAPEMESFTDNILKSASPNTVAIVKQRLTGN